MQNLKPSLGKAKKMTHRTWLNSQGIDYAHDGNGRIIKSWRLNDNQVDAVAKALADYYEDGLDWINYRAAALDAIRAYKANE